MTTLGDFGHASLDFICFFNESNSFWCPRDISSKVIILEVLQMIVGIEKIMEDVSSSCRSSPLTLNQVGRVRDILFSGEALSWNPGPPLFPVLTLHVSSRPVQALAIAGRVVHSHSLEDSAAAPAQRHAVCPPGSRCGRRCL